MTTREKVVVKRGNCNHVAIIWALALIPFLSIYSTFPHFISFFFLVMFDSAKNNARLACTERTAKRHARFVSYIIIPYDSFIL
jgi:predicted CDP-diglyceride synthetase/phosphatidate cytidylyltransferase